MNIVLIGVMGAGKTTVGRALAREKSMEFVDMDTYLESYFNRTIDDFFREGESSFRDAETEVVKHLSKQDDLVISTGGGVVLRPENVEALRENGVVVFINRDVSEIIEKVDHQNRPLLRDNPEKLYEIMEHRRPIYENAAHITVQNDGSLENTTQAILEELEGFNR